MGARLLLAAMAAGAMAGTAQVGAAGAADGTVPSTPLFATAPLPGTAKPSAGASGASAPALPSMALDPQVPESLYHGLYVGTEIFGVSGHGIKGGVGGDVYAGYDRVLGNGVIVGLQGATGYGPALLGRPGLKGFDFGEASARVGFAMGRFTPFVRAGPRRQHDRQLQRAAQRLGQPPRRAARRRGLRLCADRQHLDRVRRLGRPGPCGRLSLMILLEKTAYEVRYLIRAAPPMSSAAAASRLRLNGSDGKPSSPKLSRTSELRT